LVDRVVVSTEDAEIAEAARRYGAEVPFMRPAGLARDDSPKWPVFQHAIEQLERAPGAGRIDVLADLDCGTPLASATDVDAAIEQLLDSGADVVTTAYQAERNPYFNMVEMHDGWARIVKAPGRSVTRRQDAPPVYSLSPAVFAIRRDFVLQASHWSEGRVGLVVLPRERAIDIDHELDFQFVEFLLMKGSEL
jgi:N-acylneuraminate cytidylyltransferase/CMP-N,N'-diacetyllegionaminic acid synthase